MASPTPTSSGGTGPKKMLTYGTSSRKRSISKITREPTPSYSKPTLSTSNHDSRAVQQAHTTSAIQGVPGAASSRLTAPMKMKRSSPTSPHDVRTIAKRKRDHTAPFTPGRPQQTFDLQRLKASSASECTDSGSAKQAGVKEARLEQPGAASASISRMSAHLPIVEASQATKTPPRRRPRLIDALAAQKADTTADDGNSDEADSNLSNSNGIEWPQATQSPANHVGLQVLDRRGGTPANRKVRFTYSQARNVMSEPHTADVLASPSRGADEALHSSLTESQTISPPAIDPFGPDDSDDEKTPHAIKSVHELRRAGANNRFADEMDDLISRVGLPSVPGTEPPTLRRNALCELVQKLQRKDFLRQFRDHASRDTIAHGLGKENDIICGFALVSALFCFLSSGPAPHLLRQLTGDGVGKLLARLLRRDEDIVDMTRQKELNASRGTRLAIEGVKNVILSLPLWHGYEPINVSPRTMALQLMSLLSRCADAASLDQIILDAQPDFICVATWASDVGSQDQVDYALTVFTLATQSSAGVAPRLNSDGGHPARIAKLLSRAFRQWPSRREELDSAILKLALNTTNTEEEAAAFRDSILFARLASRIGFLFGSIFETIQVERLESEKYDELLLVLGVMINIMEHCAPARRAIDESTMNALLKLWQENQKFAGEVSFGNRIEAASPVLKYMAGRFRREKQAERSDWISFSPSRLHVSRWAGKRTARAIYWAGRIAKSH